DRRLLRYPRADRAVRVHPWTRAKGRGERRPGYGAAGDRGVCRRAAAAGGLALMGELGVLVASDSAAILDMHVHTTPTSSDSSLDPHDLVRIAGEIGLTGVNITDHDRVIDHHAQAA